MNKQKVALVTGSSKGIGKAIAQRLAKDDYFVYVTYYTDEKGGTDTAEKITKTGGKASLNKLDVSNEQSVVTIMKLIDKEFGYLDVLVNNAERDVSKPIEDSSFDEWQLAIDTKVHGAWLCTKYAIPLLKKSQNANIIFVSSNADEHPNPDVVTYAVAIAATNCFMRAMATHLPKYGIRVNAVMPGPVRTDNWAELKEDDNFWEKISNENPMKRVTTTEDVADAAPLLINDPHKFLNGVQLFVSGGSHLK